MLDEIQKVSFFLKAWQCCQERMENYQKQGETSIRGKFQLEPVWPSDTCLSLWPGRGQRTELESESHGAGRLGWNPFTKLTADKLEK